MDRRSIVIIPILYILLSTVLILDDDVDDLSSVPTLRIMQKLVLSNHDIIYSQKPSS